MVSIKREYEKEKEIESIIRSLHEDFAFQTENEYMFLPLQKVLKNNWFFEFYKVMSDNSIEVNGQKELKKLKFNPNLPSIKISGNSGIDWLDLKVELSYGDVMIPLKLLRTALINKQDYVTLSDGTLGMLPQEWVSKFSPMIKLGTQSGNKLRMSSLHFGLIDAAEEYI